MIINSQTEFVIDTLLHMEDQDMENECEAGVAENHQVMQDLELM